MRRPRVLVGLALALGVGLALAYVLLSQAREEASLEREQRRALISLHAVNDLVQRAGGKGEGVRAIITAWQDLLPKGSAVRVIALSGKSLEASTFPEDQGNKAAPRVLTGPDGKLLYDRADDLRKAVDTNREEGGARKQEIEAAPLPGGGRLLSAPVEAEGSVVGMVELATPPLPKVEPPALTPALLAFLLPLLVVLAISFAPLRRQWQLVAVAAGVFVVGLGSYGAYSLQALESGLRGTQEAVAEQLLAMGERARPVMTAQSLATEPPLQPGTWDADLYRRSLGLLTPEGKIDEATLTARVEKLRGNALGAFYGLGALGLVLLAFIGLGGTHRMGRAMVAHREAYLYIAPAMVGMLVLVFFPFISGITLSFTDSNLYNSSQLPTDNWIGLRNYQEILGDFSIARHAEDGSWVINYQNFYWTLIFTIIWTICNVTIGVTVGLLLALILNTPKLALRPIYRVLLILPWAMPNYITALIWKGMFHQQFGVINHVIRLFGGQGISWFDTPFTAFITALATNGWLSFPFMMVVSLGALQSIPGELYEAARVDGASRWQQFLAITLPSLKPALVPAIILSVVWTFNMFNIIFLVTEGQPDGATEILVTQAYKYAFQRYRYGYAAAYSTVIFGILVLYSVVQNRMSRATEAS